MSFRFNFLLFVLNLVFFNLNPASAGQEFSTLLELKEKIKSEKVKIYEPHEKKEIEFNALPIESVLNALSSHWKNQNMVLFVCKDGYKASIEVEKIKKHKAWLAFQRLKNGRPTAFEMFEKNNSNEEKKITLGPYFLIWDSINDQEIKNEEQNGWPYQIVNIEFVDLKTKFGNSRESTGIAAFQKYCLSCHSLYGTGGTVGPELASPVKITTYFKRDYLEKWILDPSSIRDRTPMPKVLPESMNLDEKKKIIREIINYLESVQKKSNS